MCRRYIWLVALSVLLAACGREKIVDSDKLTMKEVLTACGSDQSSQRALGCEDVFRAMLMTVYEASGNETDPADSYCLPDYREGVEAFRTRTMYWVRKHPEVHRLTVARALGPIMKGAYPCPALKH